MTIHALRSRASFSALALVATVACSKADTSVNDTSSMASTVTDSGSMSMSDSGMAGHDMSQMQQTPAKDADQEFLRMMIDHHEGVIVMADSAMKNGSAHVKNDGREMKAMQRPEQEKMKSLLKSAYGEDKMAMVMASNQPMISSLSLKTGAAFDRQFRESIIAHHEEALKMISDFTPRFTRPDVKDMAAKMKADQTREIAELKKELKGS